MEVVDGVDEGKVEACVVAADLELASSHAELGPAGPGSVLELGLVADGVAVVVAL